MFSQLGDGENSNYWGNWKKKFDSYSNLALGLIETLFKKNIQNISSLCTFNILQMHMSNETALQRTNTENSKQIFPEKELCGHSPNFHIHVSVSDLYIPTIDLPFLLQEICGPILGIYKSLTDT
jgi:hypothetical protein